MVGTRVGCFVGSLVGTRVGWCVGFLLGTCVGLGVLGLGARLGPGGGLLLGVPQNKLDAFTVRAGEMGQFVRVIGRVETGSGIHVG